MNYEKLFLSSQVCQIVGVYMANEKVGNRRENMSDTSINDSNSIETENQVITTPTGVDQNFRQHSTKIRKRSKHPTTPSDGLAVAGLFFVIGVFASYFPAYSHTLSIQELCQFIAYSCYSVGFLGGCFELGKLSKNQFWDSFGLEIIGAFICFGVNWLADLTNHIYIISLTIRIFMAVPLSLTAYGVIRGILYLVIKDDAPNNTNQQTQSNGFQPANITPEEKMKSEQIAGIIIATLSVVTALAQATPSLVPLFKQLLHIL